MAFILVIDDDEDIRSMMNRLLTRGGHEVRLAGGGREGYAMLEETKVDLVITDIVMAEGEGLETIAAIRKDDESVPIIAVSGGGRVPRDVYLGLAGHMGANRTLAKPFSPKDLLALVDEVLEAA